MFRESVSAVFICGEKILVVKRQNGLPAFPGHFAFVAGKVEKSDITAPTPLKNLTSIREDHLCALHREIKEEIGVDLLTLLENRELLSITHLADAVAPDFNVHRFHSFFYRIEVKCEFDFIIEESELDRVYWAYPNEVVSDYNKGFLLIVPPIQKIFNQLSVDIKDRTPIDITYRLREGEIAVVETICGIQQLFVPSHTLPPARYTNAYIIGTGENRFILDPSPATDDLKTRLIEIMRGESVRKIIISHGHPDHFERVNEIARELNLPIFLSPYTRDHIARRVGPDYFNGLSLNFLEEGDIVGDYLKEKIRVYSVPGHDEGQIALASENLTWFFVGDLIQGEGSVVIGAPEGDMGKYYQTLKRVIAMAPRFILPSHGINMGGTYYLEKVLHHRIKRENDILALYKQGKSNEEILLTLYAGIDQRLHRLAMKNIDSHLRHLKDIGQLST